MRFPLLQHPGPHALQDFFETRLPYLVFNRREAKGVAQDTGIGAAVHGHTVHRERMPHHRLHAPGEGVGVHAALSVQAGFHRCRRDRRRIRPSEILRGWSPGPQPAPFAAGRLVAPLIAHRLLVLKDRTFGRGAGA